MIQHTYPNKIAIEQSPAELLHQLRLVYYNRNIGRFASRPLSEQWSLPNENEIVFLGVGFITDIPPVNLVSNVLDVISTLVACNENGLMWMPLTASFIIKRICNDFNISETKYLTACQLAASECNNVDTYQTKYFKGELLSVITGEYIHQETASQSQNNKKKKERDFLFECERTHIKEYTNLRGDTVTQLINNATNVFDAKQAWNATLLACGETPSTSLDTEQGD